MSTNPNIIQSSASQAAPLSSTKPVEESRVRFNLSPHVRGMIIRQILLQLFLLFITATVLFPVLWIVSMAIDPRGITRPTDLNLFPPNANLDAFNVILTQQFSNVLPVYFGDLLLNSLFVALGVSLATVTMGASAAYAFSRFHFIGRQAGMLGFIVLLMLPSTGTLIPLFILFSSVQVNSTLAAAVPSFFVGALIAAVVFVAYNLARNWSKIDPDRWFNPGPIGVTIVVAVVMLIAILITFFAIFQRTEIYETTIAAPLAEIQSEYDEAKADYDRRVQSVQQRQGTALRRERRAEEAVTVQSYLTNLRDRLATVESPEEIRAIMNSELETRLEEAEDPEDDIAVQALQTALPILDSGGVAGFRAGLDSAVQQVTDEVASAQDDAATARANADEAAANLVTSETTLAAAQQRVDQEAAGVLTLRDDTLLRAIPYVVLTWIAGLAGAAVVWVIVRLLKNVIEPKALVNILLYALMAALILGIGLTALQSRMTPNMPTTQALRTTLLGLAIAFASGGLPFAIWNLKGYFDTIPKELEEAALIDGAGLFGTFIRVMIPLSLPAFAIVILFAFMQGWTEFILSWVFLTGQTQNYTLAMALATLTNGANQAPPDMQKFAALSILISLPVIILFFAFQRWIVGGLSLGGVKG
ncbi:MAG: ABC transporter permease subunit [Anaerolineae bacterium]|nr:ABC transporter permease subunit [Anaerolineae bacterium]